MNRRTFYGALLTLLALMGCGTPSTPTSAPPASPASITTAPTAPPAPTAAPQSAGALAYIVRGDLFVRALPSGAPQRLTSDGQSSSPQWSPSGAWLALCKGDDRWVLRRDGSAARRAGACGDGWLPAEGYTVAPAGSVWNDDRTAYAYVELKTTGTGDETSAPERVASLWRADADGRNATKLLDAEPADAPAPYGIMLAGWHSDQILYWQDPFFSASLLADGQPLWSIPARGGQPRQLTPTLLLYDDFRALAPDGATLALTAGGYREAWTNKRIAAVDLHSGALLYLTDERTAATSPAWSPDGQRLVYVAQPDNSDSSADSQDAAFARHIWLMSRDGSGKRQLTRDAAYRDESPRFTADGAQIIFARLDRADHVSVWTMRRDGTALRNVADDLSVAQRSDDAPNWFEYYGHFERATLFDWTAQ